MDQKTLPEQFIDRMRLRLGDGLAAFIDSMSDDPVSAFHCNTTRTHSQELLPYLSTLGAKALPGIDDSYSYTLHGIGRTALHHCGLIYSQDPAAMLPALCADMHPGIRILDLCAAPGGKTSQLAIAAASHDGIVLANEPHPERNRILRQNIERMGYRNVIVSKADPADLAAFYPETFDLILVDAPCSGEGMFRKYPESILEWSPENVSRCALRQKDILDAAVTMLASGGQLIYSTCTYAPEEDEQQVAYLIGRYGLVPQPVPDFVEALTAGCEYGSRIFYPHLHGGEGQFLASLKKPGSLSLPAASVSSEAHALPAARGALLQAAKESLSDTVDLSGLHIIEDRKMLYVLPSGLFRLPKDRITSYGVILGAMDKQGKRFLPHHQFFRAYPERFSMSLTLTPDAPELSSYLSGLELRESSGLSVSAPQKGYGVILCLGAGVGGFRYSDGRLKNLYPKGLRNP